jgi:hypothetical protein
MKYFNGLFIILFCFKLWLSHSLVIKIHNFDSYLLNKIINNIKYETDSLFD